MANRTFTHVMIPCVLFMGKLIFRAVRLFSKKVEHFPKIVASAIPLSMDPKEQGLRKCCASQPTIQQLPEELREKAIYQCTFANLTDAEQNERDVKTRAIVARLVANDV